MLYFVPSILIFKAVWLTHKNLIAYNILKIKMLTLRLQRHIVNYLRGDSKMLTDILKLKAD